jgi:flagella basal body P-ring formation protein FlgA
LLTALRSAESAKFSAGMVALVEPKKIAKLHVCSGTMQMFLDVVPLERGALHETVRVKIVGNGKILRGQVMAPGQLEAQF